MNLWQKIKNLCVDNPKKIIGALIGFILGVLFFLIGVWQTLVVLLCAVVGWLIGYLIDSGWEMPKFKNKKAEDKSEEELPVEDDDNNNE